MVNDIWNDEEKGKTWSSNKMNNNDMKNMSNDDMLELIHDTKIANRFFNTSVGICVFVLITLGTMAVITHVKWLGLI